MRVLRGWLVIPAVAALAATLAVLTARSSDQAIAGGIGAALLGAALAAAIRAFVGTGAPAAIAAASGSALGVLGWLDAGGDARGALAGAAAAFAICELVRPREPLASPWPALGAATLAATLAPAYAALPAVTAMFVVASPAPRPRWVIALPIAGVLVAALAVVAAVAHGGALARLDHAWSGHAPRVALVAVADRLGPLEVVAALAGLALCALRGRFAAAATLGVLVFAAQPAGGPALPIIAGLGAGVALGRLALLVRLPIGQAFVGAAAGFVLVAVPAWTLALTG